MDQLTEHQRVRAMLEAKRTMDATWKAHQEARSAYKKAQEMLTGGFPRCSPPGPYVCGTTFIEATNGYDRADEEVKFNYTDATRVHTSD